MAPKINKKNAVRFTASDFENNPISRTTRAIKGIIIGK
jgi:hypothetical protein